MQVLGAGEVDVRFVQRDHLDGGGEIAQEPEQDVGQPPVLRIGARQKDRFRTQAPGLSQRHAGMQAEMPRFIRAGGDHARLARLSADDHRLAAQAWLVRLFDGGEKSVDVRVQDHRAPFPRRTTPTTTPATGPPP